MPKEDAMPTSTGMTQPMEKPGRLLLVDPIATAPAWLKSQ
jgi:hypothetical protein